MLQFCRNGGTALHLLLRGVVVVSLKRFRFRLQKYLNLKQQEESIRLINLARARQYYQKQEDTMRSVQKELENALVQMREARQGGLDLDLITMGERYLQVRKEEQARQAAVLEEARAQVLLRQQELVRAQKERKLLERLYERLWSAYYREFLREEQKNLDEVGLIRFFRQQEETV